MLPIKKGDKVIVPYRLFLWLNMGLIAPLLLLGLSLPYFVNTEFTVSDWLSFDR